tara:strand:- start:1214 stop:1399 length:186 start_codon:yes stop_codon:yes gene_type:complete
MLRWLLLGFLIYGIGTGMRDGWLIVKWSQLLHEIGFTSVDPDKPLDFSEFILERLEKQSED